MGQTEGDSEEPGLLSTVPDSRLGWDFSHILAILAMTSFYLKQFGVTVVTMEIYCQPGLQTPGNVSIQATVTIVTKCFHSLFSLFLYNLPNKHLLIWSF